MNVETKIILKKGKERSVKRLHPWIFSGAIQKTIGNPAEGDVVEIFSHDNEYLAMGHYQAGTIAVRIFTFDRVEANENFWKNKIENALHLRKQLGLVNSQETNVYRLVNAEGDEMPGIVIDFYNGIIVMQIHSAGMYRIRHLLAEILKDLYAKNLYAIYDKSEMTIPEKTGLNAKNEFLFGSQYETVIKENDCKFHINVIEGQKTGFFIDQRENRRLISSYCANKEVLNVFCYTGGFSVYAAKGGARLVHSVDSSSSAIDLTNKNISLNKINESFHQAFCVDAFSYLKETNNRYNIIILDPPAFAKHQGSLKNALQAYKRINQQAIKQISPGGLLFTFSCSQVVSKDEFRKAVFAAAANTQRRVKILHQLTQPPDHPVSIYHPEGEYLKGLVLYID
jgi:23S rRNA (cytosine1962-C5)-methyltransferase